MTPTRIMFFTACAACAALALSACAPRQNLTTKQVQSVAGMTMDQVEAKLGGPYVVTNAGDSVWWDYNDITTPDGRTSGTCQVVFVNGVASKVKC
jgi:outer membrane protein assembly factor BamE (lipoprotein component of BamABCDE complex)